MRLLSTILAGAACAITVLAQTPQIAFTSVPAVVVAGSSYNITWGGGDGISPVTITLRKGNPADLETISTLTSDAGGYSYVWRVSTSLATASDYALQITQGQSEINYSGLFSLVGGTGSSSIAYSATPTSNATAASAMNMTSATFVGTAASMGTGTGLPRNTTFSSATLSLTSLSPSGPFVASATTNPSSIAATTVVQSTTAPTGAASQLVSSGTLILVASVAIFFFA